MKVSTSSSLLIATLAISTTAALPIDGGMSASASRGRVRRDSVLEGPLVDTGDILNNNNIVNGLLGTSTNDASTNGAVSRRATGQTKVGSSVAGHPGLGAIKATPAVPSRLGGAVPATGMATGAQRRDATIPLSRRGLFDGIAGLTGGLPDVNGLVGGLPIVGGIVSSVIPTATGIVGGLPVVGGLGLTDSLPIIGQGADGLPDVGGLTNNIPNVGGVTNGLPNVGGLTQIPDVGGLTQIPDVGGLTNGGVPDLNGLTNLANAGGLNIQTSTTPGSGGVLPGVNLGIQGTSNTNLGIDNVRR